MDSNCTRIKISIASTKNRPTTRIATAKDDPDDRERRAHRLAREFRSIISTAGDSRRLTPRSTQVCRKRSGAGGRMASAGASVTTCRTAVSAPTARQQRRCSAADDEPRRHREPVPGN